MTGLSNAPRPLESATMSGAPNCHDPYIAAWNEALGSGDMMPIERFLARGYHGWFAREVGTATLFHHQEVVAGYRPG
jgi:hypothetical protein